jgi:hypothetical protein
MGCMHLTALFLLHRLMGRMEPITQFPNRDRKEQS